jgi:hypothetical protein
MVFALPRNTQQIPDQSPNGGADNCITNRGYHFGYLPHASFYASSRRFSTGMSMHGKG